MNQENSLAVFEDKRIRKTWYNEEWWFVLEDVVLALTNSTDIKQYINKLRQRDEELNKGWVQIVHTLKITTSGGVQNMNCVNTEGAFRIIQSIPSPKAEPFKLWLAKVGYDRVKEIQDPELAQKRMKELYKAKGYNKDWIEKRSRGIAIRDELTDEWKKRNVGIEKEYAILTAEICKETFGMTPSEYKKFKDLKNENLRDHMTDLELIFSMLGEKVTTEVTKSKNSNGFIECEQAAKEGGEVAGNARKDAENRIGKSIRTKGNYKQLIKKRKNENLLGFKKN